MNFREFLKIIYKKKILHIIGSKVSKNYEATEISLKIKKPILFKNINNYKVITNLFYSKEIFSILFNIKKENLLHFLSNKLNNINGSTIINGSLNLGNLIEKNIDLYQYPIFKFFKNEGGDGYITSGIVVCKYDGLINASIHRLMVIDKNKLLIRIIPTRHTYFLFQKASKNKEKLPISILIGTNPFVMYACCTRVPISKEYIFASTLQEKPLELYSCLNGIDVPESEIVMEGFIDPIEKGMEGPFVDITGTFDNCRMQPVVYIEKIHYRSDPIFQSIIPSSTEHCLLMGIPYEAKMFNAISDVAIIKNVSLTEGSFFYFNAIVQIKKINEGDGKNAILASFSAHPSLKNVIIVDEDIDIYDYKSIDYAITTCVNGEKDIIIIPNIKGSSLDPTKKSNGTITKVGIDATKLLKKEYNK